MRFAFLTRPGWIVAIVGALAFAAACFWVLAPWQLDRHAQRSAQNDAIAAALAQRAVPLETLVPLAEPPAPQAVWRMVTATGVFEPERQVFVRLRQDGSGNPAAEVVLPLRLLDGTVVLVDRGYVPDVAVRAGDPVPAPPSGQVTVTGRVQLDQPDPRARPPVQENGRTYVFGIVAGRLLEADIGSDTARQGFLQLAEGSPGVLDDIGIPQVDAGPFLSYAWQWYAFGTMAALAMVFFVVREIREGPSQSSSDGEDVGSATSDPATSDAAAASEGFAATGSATAAKRRSAKESTLSQLYDP